MINAEENYKAWVLWLMELDEARDHLAELVQKMNEAGIFEESILAIDLGHIYAHLNRIWHSRSQGSEYPQISALVSAGSLGTSNRSAEAVLSINMPGA